jgi:membrane protease YdiL (CAAX protease family)
MEKALVLPIWFRVVAVVTAGIAEETLFRGYALTRLARLTGNLWLAAGLSALVFAALHFPVWGAGPSLAFFVGGLATTAFFIWRRDLLAMIIAHIAIDAWGLVVTPLYSQWWS